MLKQLDLAYSVYPVLSLPEGIIWLHTGKLLMARGEIPTIKHQERVSIQVSKMSCKRNTRDEMDDQEPTSKRLKVDNGRKKVTFAENMQVFYIEASQQDDADTCGNEENFKEATGTSHVAERTSQVTVLSSLHCKA
jgi:hypothetical protein